jgi:signal transduction histidine kinase
VDALRSLGGSEDPADGPRHLLGQLAGAMGTHCAALLAPGAEDGILCLEHPQWWQVIGMQPALMDYLMRRPQRLVADPSAVTALQPLVDTWPAGPLRWVAAARLGPERTARLLVVAGQTAQGLDVRRGQMFERFVPLLAEALRRRDDAVRARRLEQDLQQARKMESLGTLAGGIAHEINTPMQYISDNLHFLKDAFDALVAALAPAAGRPADDPELAYVLSEIPPALAQSLAGSRRVAEIVEAVRTFAYPELTLDEPVHLRGVLEHSLVITRSVWKHDVQVQLEADPAVPSLRGSPGPLSQVFVNLITNACDAARMVIGGAQGAGGLVRIALLAAPGEVVVHVDDNGPGVPPALRDRIFDPFFTTKRLGEGTGQGLGISRSIVERHGGRLFLEDGPLGGARFTVRFPL